VASKGGGRGEAVAKAYGYALSTAFDDLTEDEALLVVEDDLLFSPDLMEYMLAGWHVMKADPTLWCVSAWNDNGFGALAGDPKKILRTQFFPGLGWLLTRSLYNAELRPHWPSEHWDHWMRSEVVHRTSKGRECLVPQVPRAFHNGVEGTFMNAELHKRYFARIRHNRDPQVTWPPSEWPALRSALSSHAYERRLERLLARAAHLSDLSQLSQLLHPERPKGGRRHVASRAGGAAEAAGEGKAAGAGRARAAAGLEAALEAEEAETEAETDALALWFTQKPRDAEATLFGEIARFFGIWHEMRRGAHNGVHQLWCGGRYVLLVNTLIGPQNKKSPYMKLAPRGLKAFTSTAAFLKVRDRFTGQRSTSVCDSL